MLRPIQAVFNSGDYPDLLVGLGSPDDAAVYRLDDSRVLIMTTDFFTPIVDDPYQYGAIAAANALSDVYAMGGKPLVALNIVALPSNLPPDMISQIMLGMAEKVRESGAVIAGGHTIKDDEPKVGLAVVGLAHPDQVLTKGGAHPGDILFLSKPLGTGCITTAAKNDKAGPTHVADAVRWMMRLNHHAAEAAAAAGATAATDITGFGFLGHATEMALSSNVTLHVEYSRFPLLPGAEDYAKEWLFPGGSVANAETYGKAIRFEDTITQEARMLLFDAQTSGGLLIAVPADRQDIFVSEMDSRGASCWQVGVAGEREDCNIIVTP